MGPEFAVEARRDRVTGTCPTIAATIPSPIRGGVAGSVLAMHRLLLYALAAMNGGPFSTDPVVQEDYISPLPDALRRSLMAVHSTRRSKHSAQRQPVATRDGRFCAITPCPRQNIIAQGGRAVAVSTTCKKAACSSASMARCAPRPRRYRRAILLMCGMCEDQQMGETQLHSTEASLQPSVARSVT